MYWLGFTKNARQDAELEWDATGGTWGLATSRLLTWKPLGLFKDEKDFLEMIDKIKSKSTILANYVHRYFEDMFCHFSSLHSVLKENAKLHYIIGNSKFYDVVVPTEKIYARILEQNGFKDVTVKEIRKRSSKKELYEYQVSALWRS
jgi:hypothetical protein